MIVKAPFIAGNYNLVLVHIDITGQSPAIPRTISSRAATHQRNDDDDDGDRTQSCVVVQRLWQVSARWS